MHGKCHAFIVHVSYRTCIMHVLGHTHVSCMSPCMKLVETRVLHVLYTLKYTCGYIFQNLQVSLHLQIKKTQKYVCFAC